MGRALIGILEAGRLVAARTAFGAAVEALALLDEYELYHLSLFE